jgi:hypothetical protein
MRRDRRDLWAQAYAMMPMVDQTSALENADAAKIHALNHSGGPLTGAEQSDLLHGVEAVRADGIADDEWDQLDDGGAAGTARHL